MAMGLVLVVEDDVEVARLLERRLVEAGHEVLLAETAAQGVQRAVSEQPDAILLELRLPRGGGPLALHYLRHSFRTSHIPVVVHDRLVGKDASDREWLHAAMGSVQTGFQATGAEP